VRHQGYLPITAGGSGNAVTAKLKKLVGKMIAGHPESFPDWGNDRRALAKVSRETARIVYSHLDQLRTSGLFQDCTKSAPQEGSPPLNKIMFERYVMAELSSPTGW
jgi:hypothetical protein